MNINEFLAMKRKFFFIFTILLLAVLNSKSASSYTGEYIINNLSTNSDNVNWSRIYRYKIVKTIDNNGVPQKVNSTEYKYFTITDKLFYESDSNGYVKNDFFVFHYRGIQKGSYWYCRWEKPLYAMGRLLTPGRWDTIFQQYLVAKDFSVINEIHSLYGETYVEVYHRVSDSEAYDNELEIIR